MNQYIKYIILFFTCFVTYNSFSQTIPSAMLGLQAWFAADSLKVGNGNPIDTVKAINNEFLFVAQPTTTNKPILVDNVLNGKPVMRFDGVDDYLNGGNILNFGNTGQTVFIIGKSINANGSFYAKSSVSEIASRHAILFSGGSIYYVYQDNSPHYLFTPSPLNTYTIISSNINSQLGKADLFINGEKKDSENISKTYSMNSNYLFLIGGYNTATGTTTPPYPGFYLNGDIAEIIIYNRSLNQIERQEIENYLRIKYFPGTERLQFTLGPDITEPYIVSPITLTVPPQAYYVSYEWNTGETTSSISVDTSGTYIVKVIDDWGYEYYDTIVVTKPQITPQANDLICDGESITWDCGLSGAYTYLWSTGETSQSIEISDEGDYSVTVEDSFGNTQTSNTATITLDDFSTSASLGPDTVLCEGNIIELVTRKADAINYVWNTSETTPEIEFTTAGEYSVIATNANSCIAYDTVTISTKGVAPTVQITSNSICKDDVTILQDDSYTTDGTTIIGTTWYIGNDTLNGNSVSYTFPTIGANPIRVVAETNVNCFGVLNTSIDIAPKPVINFIPPKACSNGETNFKSTSTISSGTIQSYLWTIEGEQFTEDSIIIRFANTGIFPVTLTGISNIGCSSSATKNIEVREGPQLLLLSTKTCENDPVFFFDKTTYPPYNTVVDGNWFFDGTAMPYYPSIGKLYTDTNTHIVKLEVKTNNGCINSISDTIKIHAAPLTIIPPIYGCKNKEFIISDASNTYGDSITLYNWQINSVYYSSQNPIVEFADTGNYAIELYIETENECTGNATGTITIEVAPTANFSFTPEFGAVPLEIEFINESINADSYLWNFEQQSTSTDENPVYTFTDKLNSFAKLYAYSPHFCVDSVIKFIPIQLADQRLEIIDFEIIPTGNGYITYEVHILNTGNTAIRLIDFIIENPEFPAISETWTGSLGANDVLTYTFVAHTKAQDEDKLPYACISANLRAAHDYTTYFTDTDCKDFTGEFGIYRIAPNPADDKTNVKFSTKKTGNITLTCIDENGKPFLIEEFKDITAGFHTRTIDVSRLPIGTYMCKISQDNQTAIMYFIKK